MSTHIPMFGGALPVWADVLIGVLLIISGLLSFTGALGLVRIREFFTRLHPLALGSTLALWCVAAALVLCFSFTYQTLMLRAWLVVVFTWQNTVIARFLLNLVLQMSSKP